YPGAGRGPEPSHRLRSRAPAGRAATTCGGRAMGPSAHGPVGQQRIERGVALVDAHLHVAAEHLAARLEGAEQGGGVQSGPAAAEILDAQSLERDLLGPAVEGERLDDAIVGDVVEAAVEGVLLPVGPDVDEGPGSPGASVPVLDAGGEL